MENLSRCPICNHNEFDPWMECEDYFLTREAFTIQQCKKCNFRFVNPRPFSHELGRYYQSSWYISHNSASKSLWNYCYTNIRKYTISKKYEIIKKYAEKGSILDIGCATGEFLNFFKGKNWNTRGIEPDENARKQAIEKYGLNVGDESEIDEIASGSFEVITMWHVLEHVSDLNTRMNDVLRLLKKEGTLVLALPNCNSADAEIYGKYWAAYDVPRHLYHFTPDTITRLLDKHGFKLMEKIPMKFDAYYVSLLSEKYKTGTKRWIPAIRNGWNSNRRAEKKGGFSSMIYIAKLKLHNFDLKTD
jgi:2-polyprenyl-3-methyl-5-hydroxy-6-metoxy-1,4-benzoquinol methylase